MDFASFSYFKKVQYLLLVFNRIRRCGVYLQNLKSHYFVYNFVHIIALKPSFITNTHSHPNICIFNWRWEALLANFMPQRLQNTLATKILLVLRVRYAEFLCAGLR